MKPINSNFQYIGIWYTLELCKLNNPLWNTSQVKLRTTKCHIRTQYKNIGMTFNVNATDILFEKTWQYLHSNWISIHILTTIYFHYYYQLADLTGFACICRRNLYICNMCSLLARTHFSYKSEYKGHPLNHILLRNESVTSVSQKEQTSVRPVICH